ncbi:hypothetical protein GCM10011367_18030 [Marinicauda pacifica]|jgi:Co/Zn/Cd efflux system component|uniref:Cation transporter n=1 Tax=Marinicauda pacifica TaxID=1133559 RepID=A0A4S2HCK6_9PROT|nr:MULTISPECIES: cation transporter [Marinicauda]TGY93202.1 cation transporter [Marinicauda pacifica]GGE43714.1 hypothetical protein GCM10011367_18030 [Marinicauda pacifica]
MSGCGCDPAVFDGQSRAYRRALMAVIAINAAMFLVEGVSGFAAGSQALKADALDFAGDAATYAISLAVIGMAVTIRASASLIKALSLGVLALAIVASSIARLFSDGTPQAEIMGLVGLLALAANLVSVLILLRWKDGDSNVRSVWLCSRNDSIGNVAVMGAGGLVALTGSVWPDLLVAFALAGLFLRSGAAIAVQALGELRDPRNAGTGAPQ